jgi:hypothetical protein
MDLLMGCECELKAHITLSRLQDDTVKIYKQLKTAGHSIDKLTEMAQLMEDRSH